MYVCICLYIYIYYIYICYGILKVNQTPRFARFSEEDLTHPLTFLSQDL